MALAMAMAMALAMAMAMALALALAMALALALAMALAMEMAMANIYNKWYSSTKKEVIVSIHNYKFNINIQYNGTGIKRSNHQWSNVCY